MGIRRNDHGRVVEKRYTPAKPKDGHVQVARAEDEFQLLIERRGGEQSWITVTEDQYHAGEVGQRFHSGWRRLVSNFRASRDSAITQDPTAAAHEQLIKAATSGW